MRSASGFVRFLVTLCTFGADASLLRRGRALEDPLAEAAKALEPSKKKMDMIEQMRADMCNGRKDLVNHEDCTDFLVETCSKKKGEQCDTFKSYIAEECENGSKKACKYAEQMGMKQAAPTEKPTVPPVEKPASAPAPAPAAAAPVPASAPEAAPEKPTAAPLKRKGFENKKANQPLHSQGYSEHSSNMVKHKDGDTMTSDWGREWPRSKESEQQSIEKICSENPGNAWCKRNGYSL